MKMKPCPFCGCKDITYYTGWKFGDRTKDEATGTSPSICCDECSIGVSVGWFGRGFSDRRMKAITIADWNRRIGEDDETDGDSNITRTII